MKFTEGYEYSFNGFVDYSSCFPSKEVLWIIVGAALFFGIFISVIPQIIKLISKRTNYGLNPFFVCMTNFGHFVVLTNIISLHTTDFIAILQVPFYKAIPTYLTFMNAFILWFAYHPVIYLNLLFFDKAHRKTEEPSKTRKARFILCSLTIILDIIFVTMISILFGLGFAYGFQSSQVQYLGHVCGFVAMFVCIFQYFPQFITTCILRDHGSLSLVMLGIQFPGGFLNAFFMCFGQKEHWTSWLSTMAAAAQQMLLFILCLIFKVRNKIKRSSVQTGESIITERGEYEAIK
ncbi:PQ loop repeat family protein [Tritrichomonas foetus]|uniref:PQ loop repeat family protein n=1 Tax=Tritrichomonas foetus TaxID=1144522 RepID=A0A1J4JH86_9EUKA|nr:PQ loop repeat family protein [Tritrichomonas foetus]|eukprot:OHS97623.1 PQ loop repeat family protein [Tritrichomonas foetus]